MKKLPIGRQVYKRLIEDNCVYVDKTRYFLELIEQGSPTFISRPRRFGKSLTTHTLEELFRGSKELFKDTYAYENWDFSKTYPVIRLDMSQLSATKTIDVFTQDLKLLVYDTAKEHNITLRTDVEPHTLLRELIIELAPKKGLIAIIVDEYDSPLLNTLNTPMHDEIKTTLRDFYAVIKANEKHLKFIFITGVSKFSKLNIFSSMNNLVDITIHHKYTTIMGYTKEDINTNFREYIELAKEKHKYSEEQFWEKLTHYYNGYSWDGKNFLFNPFSILSFFDALRFAPYWMETGSPSYIVKYAEQNNLSLDSLKGTLVDINFMDKRDIDNVRPASFLTQAGYLTIKDINEYDEITLDFPNYEVEYTFNNLLIGTQYKVDEDDILGIKQALRKAFTKRNTEEIIIQLKTIYSSIPYVHFDNNKNEHFYHTILLMFLRACGYEVLTEDLSNKGRSDLSLFWEKRVYLIELKVNGSAESALKQIKQNNYTGKYTNKECIHIGLKIDLDERNIISWAY